jgi:tetratricopeptide (TPR) repeat protein
MTRFSDLLREIHQRSIWQVIGIYLAMSWGVLNAVDVLTGFAGLPDWTPTMAVVLLLIGFPIVTATAVIQKGMPGGGGGENAAEGAGSVEGAEATDVGKAARAAKASDAGLPGSAPENLAAGTGSLDRPSTRPSSTKRLFTWRNAILGGAGAFALLGFSLVAYFVMWETGIGPVGNLEAQGVFEEGEAVVLADFQNTSSDATLGRVVTEALRVDLASSQAITLVTGSRISEILELMEREPGDGLPPEVAREVAIRGGIKAVVDGEVGSAGSGYILSATIRAVESGEPLATFRRTAASPDEVISAIDGLSQDIRERAGESLRSIKSEASLEQFTTASLEALRLYSEADRAADVGDEPRAKELLLEALRLDPDFAMAWRKLAVALQSAAGEPGELEAAATRAYELSERLTPLERGQAVAYYHNVVSGDLQAGIRAYEEILRNYPDDRTALNNIAILFSYSARFEEAIERLNQAISGPGVSSNAYINAVFYYSSLGRMDEAGRMLDEVLTRYPGMEDWNLRAGFTVAAMNGDVDEAAELAERLVTLPGATTRWRHVGSLGQLMVAGLTGEWAAGSQRMADLIRRQRAEGDAFEEMRLSQELADFEYSVRGDSQAARSIVQKLIADGVLNAVPAQARRYQELVELLIRAGSADLAADLLQEWSEVGESASRTVIDDLGVVVEAMSSSDLEANIRGIDQYRARTLCARCFGWTYASLLYEAGRVEGAARAYEEATRVAQTGGFSFFSVTRFLGHERLGEIYEELGDSVRAAEHYAVFADAWPIAEPGLAARKDRARERATALGGE